MYRWTDPIDPDGAPRRAEPPTDHPPAWFTDRPEPRSSYLFGDEPAEPGDAWHREQPTEWPATGPVIPSGGAATPAAAAAGPTTGHETRPLRASRPARPPRRSRAPTAPDGRAPSRDPAGAHSGFARRPQPTTAAGPPGDGRPRSGRHRPLAPPRARC